MKNPFKFGEVIKQENFCNRRDELADLETYVKNCSKVFVYSERRFGKTSLVKLVQSRFEKEYLTTYLDLWKTNSEFAFANLFAKTMTASFADPGQKLAEAAGQILNKLKPVMTLGPDGSPQLSLDAAKRVPEHTIEEVLKVPQQVAEKKKKRVLVILDEIQEILAYESDTVQRHLRAAIQTQPEVAYIFLGSRKHLMEEMTLTESRPLYRAGVHYALPPISENHWIPFIAEKFQSFGDKRIDEEHCRALLTLSDNQPEYTQQLCFELWECTPEKGQVDENLLQTAVDKILKQENDGHASTWRRLKNKEQEVLKNLAADMPLDKDLAKELISEELVDLDSQDHPYIVNRNLKLWVKKNK